MMSTAEEIKTAINHVVNKGNTLEMPIMPNSPFIHIRNKRGRGLTFWKSLDSLKRIGFKIIDHT